MKQALLTILLICISCLVFPGGGYPFSDDFKTGIQKAYPYLHGETPLDQNRDWTGTTDVFQVVTDLITITGSSFDTMNRLVSDLSELRFTPLIGKVDEFVPTDRKDLLNDLMEHLSIIDS